MGKIPGERWKAMGPLLNPSFSHTPYPNPKPQTPAATFGEMGKILGERWKAMGPEDKAKYDRQAAEDKQRYAGVYIRVVAAAVGKLPKGVPSRSHWPLNQRDLTAVLCSK